MSFTNFLETEILDHVFAGAAYTAPSTKYIGLFTAISDGEAGSVTEVSGNAYARQAMAFTTSGATIVLGTYQCQGQCACNCACSLCAFP